MTSILRPLMPPWALMSSAAMTAALVSEAPATDDSSPITPILIASGDCAEAGWAESASARLAHPISQKCILLTVFSMLFLPFARRGVTAGQHGVARRQHCSGKFGDRAQDFARPGADSPA